MKTTIDKKYFRTITRVSKRANLPLIFAPELDRLHFRALDLIFYSLYGLHDYPIVDFKFFGKLLHVTEKEAAKIYTDLEVENYLVRDRSFRMVTKENLQGMFKQEYDFYRINWEKLLRGEAKEILETIINNKT